MTEGYSQSMSISFPFSISTDKISQPVVSINNSASNVEIQPVKSGNTLLKLNLFGLPVKNVKVKVHPQKSLCVVGKSVGICIDTKGVLVLGKGVERTKRTAEAEGERTPKALQPTRDESAGKPKTAAADEGERRTAKTVSGTEYSESHCQREPYRHGKDRSGIVYAASVFQHMIRCANRHLERMAAGQFLLKCRSMENLSTQGNTGLDLDVYSLITGKVRDVKTLSGGESFMAALALALGMTDVITQAVGAVHIDTLFIDEGFGSLDENAREQAIRILQGLSGGSRLVGIISHVTELKEQIEQKLVVTKGKTGSKVEWK